MNKAVYYRPQYAASQPDDPHQDDVYQWEESWPEWNRNLIGIRAARTLIRTACDSYNVPYPIVVSHGNALSWSMPKSGRISMQGGEHRAKGGMNVATALHETAHHIAWHKHGEKIQDHGPTFLGIYLDLLDKARVAPRVALEASARTFGLTWRKE